MLTCDVSQVPKDKWTKRRTLSAVVIAVLPVKVKGSTTRRHIVLRDEHGECVVCVWGNHTQVVNESTIGRSITIFRVTLQDYEGAVQISMPKDASIVLGNTVQTTPILSWLHKKGNNCMPVKVAALLESASIIAIHGVLAKVTTESITMKDGPEHKLTTVILADGPPQSVVPIQFWNAKPDQVSNWKSMLHESVNATYIRCHISVQRGTVYESIGTMTKITRITDPQLEKWWFGLDAIDTDI